MILCDTNILIEISKNNQAVSLELQAIGIFRIAVSSITAGEFIYGALNKADLLKIKKALDAIQIIHVDELISDKHLSLLEKHSLSHNLTVPDALIAATALVNNFQLYTFNVRDFRFIEGLELYKA